MVETERAVEGMGEYEILVKDLAWCAMIIIELLSCFKQCTACNCTVHECQPRVDSHTDSSNREKLEIYLGNEQNPS